MYIYGDCFIHNTLYVREAVVFTVLLIEAEVNTHMVKPLIFSFCSKKLPQLRISAWRKKLMYKKKA